MHLMVSVVSLICLNVVGVRSEIVAVVQVISNGKSTPKSFYKTDKYNHPSYWADLDKEQLTNEGKRQHFNLGQYTRKRYGNFLPSKYDNSVFYAQTTDVDTSHMSIQTNIYGLFPAESSQIWRKNVDWQAIPVHPADERIFGYSYPNDCRTYTTLLNQILNNSYAYINELNTELFGYLTKNTGDKITDIISLYNIWDTLYSEDLAGYKLPNWTQPIYPEPMKTVAGKYFQLLTYNAQMKKLVTGPFFNKILEYFDNKANDLNSLQKFQMYSGHDTNLAAYLNVLEAFDPTYPPEPASSMYFELHKENFVYNVKIFYKNNDDIKQIKINGSDTTCSLKKFRKILGDLVIDETTRDAECSTG